MTATITEWQKLQYLTAKSILEELLELGFIDRNTLRGNIVDWGCGTGGGSLAFLDYGANVRAVDKCEKSIAKLASAEILPSDKFFTEDGVAFLRRQPECSVDVVAAFLFGPPFVLTGNPRLFPDFYQEANRVIRPEGRIIMTSDPDTFEEIKSRVGRYGDVVDLKKTLVGYGSTQAFVGRKQREVEVSPIYGLLDLLASRKNEFGKIIIYKPV